MRGPAPAYVELIAAGSEESNPWLDRVRSARGPISWAIAVDDIEAARDALAAAGFDPQPVVAGSRRTPDGGVVEWRLCDVGEGPYDGALPFLIQWTTPMEPGPEDGPVVQHVGLTPADPDRLADLLAAVGLVPSRHWPRRMFHDASGAVSLTLGPPGEPEDLGDASWTMSWEDPAVEPPVSLALRVPDGGLARHTLDGVAVTTVPDRRRFAAAALQPVGGGGSALARAEAWVEALVSAGLASAEDTEVEWAEGIAIEMTGATRLSGPSGTQPITVVRGMHPLDRDDVVVIGIGDPVEVLERQPTFGRSPVAEQVDRVDDAFVLALSGGVYAVRGRRRSVTRHLDGWGSSGPFAEGEAERWLADADAGRRTEGVVAGKPWLS